MTEEQLEEIKRASQILRGYQKPIQPCNKVLEFFLVVFEHSFAVLVERRGFLIVCSKSAEQGVQDQISEIYPNAIVTRENLSRPLKRQAHRIWLEGLRKRGWQEEFLQDTVPPRDFSSSPFENTTTSEAENKNAQSTPRVGFQNMVADGLIYQQKSELEQHNEIEQIAVDLQNQVDSIMNQRKNRNTP